MFGCVEIDSTCYNYPQPSSVKAWIRNTPAQFLFHVKLFGFLCSRGGSRRSLPLAVRALLPETTSDWITDKQLPPAALQLLWDLSNDLLTPFIASNKMGIVLLQFHTSFYPSTDNMQYIRTCRRHLRDDVRMAVEFRNRNWLRGEQKRTTLRLLQSIGCGLVASDDLEHEVKQRDRNQQGLAVGASRVRLRPVVATELQHVPEFLYCRVHRRHGTDRVLRQESIDEWSTLLQPMAQTNCHVYFLWGTDHRDQPLVNGRALFEKLPPSMQQHWKRDLLQSMVLQKGSLLSMLSQKRGSSSSSSGSSSGGSSSGGSSGSSGSSSSSSGSGSGSSGSSSSGSGGGGEQSTRVHPQRSKTVTRGGSLLSMLQKNATPHDGNGTETPKEKKVFRYSIGSTGPNKKKRKKGISAFFNKTST